MKLIVVLCACALAAADQQEGDLPDTNQLAVGLGYLYRRFLQLAAPDQVKLQDALDVKWRRGMMSNVPFRSSSTGTFDGTERNSFSFITSLISPEQKGPAGLGHWVKNDISDVIVSYHYGASVKVHFLTDGGIHKEAILGNPLNTEDAKFVIVIPKHTYCTFESLSEDHFTFNSFVAVPGWVKEGHHEFSLKEMGEKFPDHQEMFQALAKPGISKESHDHDDHHDDHDDHDHKDHHHGHRGHRSHRRH